LKSRVELPISDREAALVLSALGYFDEEVLPYSVPRIELYKLIKYIQETFGFGVCEGYAPASPEEFIGEVRTLDLSPDTADYIERALWCAISLGSCEMEMDSEYAGGFSRDLQDLCSVDLRLTDILGPRCFEPLPQNKRAWDEVFGVS
jgi:hypothetical protein